LAADFENYRKRIDREREEFQAVGMQKALEAILPALDDLDMAQSKLTEKTEPKVMLDSLKMVCNRFGRCLEQVAIKQMQPIGEPFDPMYHEPVQEVPTNDVPDGCVAHQLRNGYMFRDKVLRPALVNVAVALTGEAAEAYEQAQSEKNAAAAGEVIDITPVAAAVEVQAEEVMVPSSGTETSESLESIGNERSTQDIPFEEIKAAYEASLSANDSSSQAGSETSSDDQAAQSAGTGKVYDLTDVEE
jgi:hypothetical protein